MASAGMIVESRGKEGGVGGGGCGGGRIGVEFVFYAFNPVGHIHIMLSFKRACTRACCVHMRFARIYCDASGACGYCKCATRVRVKHILCERGSGGGVFDCA